MKKKVVCSLLAAAMAVSMTACGSGSASTAASTSGSSGTSSTSAAADSSAEAASTSSGSTEAEAVTSGSTAAEAVASASTAATGESAAVKATGDKPTIAFVPKVMGQAWWDYVQKSVESWSSEAGIDVIYKGPTEIDAAAQVQIMTDLVNQGVDILCFSPNDPDACEAICKQARDKGIIVIATEASGMKNVDYDVEAFDETGMGAFLMDELAKQMGEKGKYVTMVGSLTMESQNNWADAAIAEQEKKYPVRRLYPEEIQAALDLTWEVFLQFEAPVYSDEGIAEFRKSLDDKERTHSLQFYGAFDKDKLIGTLCMRAPQHIGGFFVNADYHRKGIGRDLFERMRRDYDKQEFTVNSSPYAVEIYKKLGFEPTDVEQTVNGLRFTPMVFRLHE